MTASLHIDVAIFGGGAAGLWLLDELTRAGYRTILLEAHELGSGQTIASQGIIHGGLKYTLSGLLTPSARAISQMPDIWRKCLAGERKPDLSSTRLRAQYCHLWRTRSITSRLAMIGARAGLRVAPITLAENDRPHALRHASGMVARLDEQVIDPQSFLADLATQHRAAILKIDLENGLEFVMGQAIGPVTKQGLRVEAIRLINPETGDALDIHAGFIVLTAGSGNAALRGRLGLSECVMQRRALHMAMARSPHLPTLNAHCVDGAATRVTITTAKDAADRIVWQIGGQLAEAGVSMEPQQLVKHAQRELRAVLPTVDFSNVQWATYRVDRAEAAMRGGSRPENAHAEVEGNIITAWPTKLALAPALAKRVMKLLSGAKPRAEKAFSLQPLNTWPRPVVALPPWETQNQWFTGD